MARQIVECVPNFSEGRDASVVQAIADAIGRTRGVAVLDVTMDADHNRCVVTFAGSPGAVRSAAVTGVGEAVARIDLTRQQGVHPRIGAADVVPFVPVEGIDMAGCVELACHAGEEIWSRHGVPVYLYEAAARSPNRRNLEDIRRGQFELLREQVMSDASRRPDIGGPELHPTAGATVVGARKFLIAYNVNLATSDVAVAKEIARAIRASSGGFPCVKALGLPLASRNMAQVSMNLTDFEVTPLHRVFDAIHKLASKHGVAIAGSEIIGLMPQQALEFAAAHYLKIEHFRPEAVLERRVRIALDDKLEGEC